VLKNLLPGYLLRRSLILPQTNGAAFQVLPSLRPVLCTWSGCLFGFHCTKKWTPLNL